MSTPMDVTVVRPKWRAPDAIRYVVGHGIGLLFNGWIVMLLVPVVVDLHPGYWKSVAAVLLLDFLLPSSSSWSLWTKAAK